MNQTDTEIVNKTRITGNAVIINQCDAEGYSETATEHGTARMYSVTGRGLTKSRNLAIERSQAEICQLCDDDEEFLPDYEEKIISAYDSLPDADVIAFKMSNRPPSFKDKVIRLRFPLTAKVSSWQISFRRQSLVRTGVRFDPLMGAGSGNGAEEELKFLTDCRKAKLKIYYVPYEIASVAQSTSTWFAGFNEQFFRDRGNTTRYIMGLPLSVLYALYYVLTKRGMYSKYISPSAALKATMSGIRENRLSKLSKQKGESL
ncbi:MAG: glycosyltransferase [Eubacterium sp.]|nr:glycosyltransferase [Eubacterium sp.]